MDSVELKLLDFLSFHNSVAICNELLNPNNDAESGLRVQAGQDSSCSYKSAENQHSYESKSIGSGMS